jgi:hypothetical protein
VEFEARCFLCGVPFTEDSVNGGRCLACGGTIVGVARTELVKNWYGYIASFLRKAQPFQVDANKRRNVKLLLFGFTYRAPPEEPSEHRFVQTFLGLLQDPTEDRQRALAALARDWLGWARTGVPPL